MYPIPAWMRALTDDLTHEDMVNLLAYLWTMQNAVISPANVKAWRKLYKGCDA